MNIMLLLIQIKLEKTVSYMDSHSLKQEDAIMYCTLTPHFPGEVPVGDGYGLVLNRLADQWCFADEFG